MGTTEGTEASPSAEQQQRGSSPEGHDWETENLRLRQELKKAQDLNRQALPLAQIGVALQQAKGGREIIQKLERNEDLTVAEEKKVEKEAVAAGYSPEQIDELLGRAAQTFEERYWQSRKAERAMDELHQWAEKEYPGYRDLLKTEEWNDHVNLVLAKLEQRVQQGKQAAPDGWDDPYRYAVHETYNWVKAMNPKIGEKKPAKKTEGERRAAIGQTGVEAGGVPPEDSDEIPEYARLDKQPRSLGGGRSFSSLKRS